jgi:hypothetical protein
MLQRESLGYREVVCRLGGAGRGLHRALPLHLPACHIRPCLEAPRCIRAARHPARPCLCAARSWLEGNLCEFQHHGKPLDPVGAPGAVQGGSELCEAEGVQGLVPWQGWGSAACGAPAQH